MSEWKEVTIEELCDVTRGASPRPIHDFLRDDVGVPWVKIADAKVDSGFRYIEETKQYIRPEGVSKSRSVKVGDFILSNSATPGVPRIMSIDACVHDGWLILRNFDDVSKWFLYYAFCAHRERLLLQANGSVFSNLKTATVKAFPIMLPALEEQEAIAEVLSSLDDKIDLLKRQNKTLEGMAEALFRQWFIEEAQDDWEEVSIDEVFDFTMGQSPPGNSFNEEGIGVPMYQGNADFGMRFPSARVYTTEPKRLAGPGDVLMSVRAPVGAVNMAKELCCIGRGVAAFRFKEFPAYDTYTLYKIKAMISDFMVFNEQGTVFGSIGKGDLLQMVVLSPPTNIIERFEVEAGPMDHKIRANANEIELLEKKRDALLPKLMSGEVRVKLD